MHMIHCYKRKEILNYLTVKTSTKFIQAKADGFKAHDTFSKNIPCLRSFCKQSFAKSNIFSIKRCLGNVYKVLIAF